MLRSKIKYFKRNSNKYERIKIDDVELNLPKEVKEARKYQYNLIKFN